METEDSIKQPENIKPYKNKVHKILAYSYIFYFVSFLVGLFFDFIFPVIFFENYSFYILGVVFLYLGTYLVIWAQISSHRLTKEIISKKIFCSGPYCYTRTPTHIGLFLLMFGFGILVNALFIIIFSIISFLIIKFTFIKKEEEVLALKYGDPYLEYKKSVRF